MAITREVIEGRPATVADYSKNMIKIIFDDGEITFATLDTIKEDKKKPSKVIKPAK